ncbi:zinc ribbon domain-containing protein [Paenibacillus sp. P22]|uniref:zinc ribbon domain-containing protein n=1 Tax=Paenibacillus TaxID=44249 RepID=UPI000433438A|nr:zinc ribbon domain-containing protein [Paenibacillus sp. P22]CDN44790.1 Putative uncharacterized protein [Paenibacillus sp. P22]
MSLFDRMKQGAAEAAKAAQQTMEIARLKSLIVLKQRDIGKQKKAIGDAVYEAYLREDIASSHDSAFRLCQGIVTAEHDIAELQEKIRVLKTVKACPSCGREVELGAGVCTGCGHVFPQVAAAESLQLEGEVRVLCGSCRTENALDARRCASCGKELGSWA